MPPKRQSTDDGHTDAPSRKEQKLIQRRDARSINVQSSRTHASSSRATPALPSQLEVEQSIEARKFQIRALQRAINLSRSSSSTRAWQLLPRHARRRAASHNLLRLPARLRTKGLSELRASNTEPKTRSQVRSRLANHPRSKALARKEELLLRAARPGKNWLETHLWFAKRFRMSKDEHDGPRWGYILPEESSMKGKKTDWRATKEGCAVFDASYNEWIRISCKVAKGDEREQTGVASQSSATSPLQKSRRYLMEILQLAGIRTPGHQSLELQNGSVIEAVLHTGNPGASDCAVLPLEIYPVIPSRQTNRIRNQGSRALPRSQMAKGVAHSLSLLGPPPALSYCQPDYEVLLRVHPAARVALYGAMKRSIGRRQKGCDRLSRIENGTHIVLTLLEKPDANTLLESSSHHELKGGKCSHSSSSDSCSPGSRGTAVSKIAKNLAPSLAQMDDSSQGEASEKDESRTILIDRMNALKRVILRRRSFNVLELYGPRSGRVLGDILHPIASTPPDAMAAFQQIQQCKTPPSSETEESTRLVLNLFVTDPRLACPRRSGKGVYKSYDRRPKASINPEIPNYLERAEANLLSDGKNVPRYSVADIDRRRSQQLVPGSRLQPTPLDDIIPIALVPRGPCTCSRKTDGSSCLSGYSLIVPQGWSVPFFHALISASARPLSQSSLRSLYHENATPSYPYDWVGSPGYSSYVSFYEAKRQAEWSRRPSSKRINWEAAGTRWPFGGQEMWEELARNSRRHLLAYLDSHAVRDSEMMEMGKQDKVATTSKVHLMGSSDLLFDQVRSLQVILGLNTKADDRVSLSKSSTRPPARRVHTLRSILACVNSIASHPFVLIQVRAMERGNFDQGDEVHLEATIAEQGASSAVFSGRSSSTHVGTVTSGGFSLSKGSSCAVGVVAREAWLVSSLGFEADEGKAKFVVRSRSGGPVRSVMAYTYRF